MLFTRQIAYPTPGLHILSYDAFTDSVACSTHGNQASVSTVMSSKLSIEVLTYVSWRDALTRSEIITPSTVLVQLLREAHMTDILAYFPQAATGAT